MAEEQGAFAQRRMSLLGKISGPDLSQDVVGGKALANLACGQYVREANEKLRAVAQWFVLPHPKGRDPYGEGDFAAMKLMWAYYRFFASGLLEAETLEHIHAYFLNYDFQSKYMSENHRLLFHTSRYLMACAYPDEEFGRYGIMGRKLAELDCAYLLEYLRLRARQGWEEFDSGNYLAPIWESLCALHDFAPDQRLRLAARMMLNVRLMDFIVDSLGGMYCGAHGRIYERQALDHQNECTCYLSALYFGHERCNPENPIVEALLSDFTPEPILQKIWDGRSMPYENRERSHLHCSTYNAPQRPLRQEPGSLRKLTYVSAQYALGCVQWQDRYPAHSLAAGYAGHQQHDWDLTFAGENTRRRIFTHHPGHNGAEGAEHGYWTGDMLCTCGCHFQQGPAVVSLHDIAPEQPYQFIHAHLPRALFERVEEDAHSVYVQHGDVYAMLRFVHPYRWTREGLWRGIEIISEGARNGVVCEVSTSADFDGFDAFVQEMKGNRLHLDDAMMRLTYTSKRAGVLTLSFTERLHNGKPVDLDYATYDSPYMHAGWDEGVVRITDGEVTLVCDFMETTMTYEGVPASDG